MHLRKVRPAVGLIERLSIFGQPNRANHELLISHLEGQLLCHTLFICEISILPPQTAIVIDIFSNKTLAKTPYKAHSSSLPCGGEPKTTTTTIITGGECLVEHFYGTLLIQSSAAVSGILQRFRPCFRNENL